MILSPYPLSVSDRILPTGSESFVNAFIPSAIASILFSSRKSLSSITSDILPFAFSISSLFAFKIDSEFFTRLAAIDISPASLTSVLNALSFFTFTALFRISEVSIIIFISFPKILCRHLCPQLYHTIFPRFHRLQ